LPDFSWSKKTKTGKFTKWPQTITNGHKLYQMATKYTKWPYNVPTPSMARPSKIYPNSDFWFENIPSGNPAFKGQKRPS
jgi:hypothetical protein